MSAGSNVLLLVPAPPAFLLFILLILLVTIIIIGSAFYVPPSHKICRVVKRACPLSTSRVIDLRGMQLKDRYLLHDLSFILYFFDE